MKIQTKLHLGTIVTTALVFIFIAAIIFLTFAQQQLSKKGQIAEGLSETSFQLSLLRSEYLAHPNERPKTQWIHTYEVQSHLLENAAPLFRASQEAELFEGIRTASEDSRALFGELIENIEHNGSKTVIEELSNQMTVKAQTRVSNAVQLAGLSRQVASDAEQAFMFTIIVLGMVVAGISIGLYLSSTKIAESIRKLGEGTKIIADGNLAYQLEIRGSDEITEVAQLFNDMTKELQTSRTSLEEKVQKRTKEISTILRALDNVALVSMTDAKGDIIYANDKFVKVSKYTREELIGKNHRILKSGQQPKSLFVGLWNTISHGKIWRGEIMNRAKDGTYYWVDTSIAPILGTDGKPERYISVRFLITYEKNAVREIQKFQEAVEASTDAIAITLPNLEHVYVNPMWERLTGYPAQEALGKTPQMILSETTDAALVNTLLALPNAEGEKEAEKEEGGEKAVLHSDLFIHKRKDGSEYNAETSAYPIREKGKVAFFTFIHRDVTQRKRADRSKSEFISLASHQLRTPLTEIRWALSSLIREDLEKNQKHFIEAAHSAASHMAETINTMLTISHIETGELQPKYEAVPLLAVLNASLQLYEMHRQRKSLNVTLECSDQLTLRMDNQLLQEIFGNLISNAYKYTPHGGTVCIKAEKQADNVRISITDTGLGIPQSEQPRLFTKFFRASNVVNTKEEGSGIGLYMVYALTKVLGGTISCSSEESKGTTFTLVFPSTL